VLGPVPGVLGSLQALEAIKLLAGLPGQLGDAILILDLLTLDSRKLHASRHPDCGGRHGMQTKTPADRLELEYASLKHASGEGLRIVDIRERHEAACVPIDAGALHIPMGALLEDVSALDPQQRYLLVCSHGIRSQAAAHELRARGLRQVYSLRGGLGSLQTTSTRK
jgi:adenylyltransferase/sulfurtransferase